MPAMSTSERRIKAAQSIQFFQEVISAYTHGSAEGITNNQLYASVAMRAGIPIAEFNSKSPVGKDREMYSLMARRVRWHQQSLRAAGIIERVPGERGVWKMTRPEKDDLDAVEPGVSVVGFSTELGVAILGSCYSTFSRIDDPITLCLTSPPYPLAKQRDYGNPNEREYVDWVCNMLEPIVKNLVPGGSIALNISNDVFMAGSPARSTYRERLVIALTDRLGLHLMDQLIWHNGSKAPGPIQWASIHRVQLNTGWEPVYWFTNDPQQVKSDNRRVLLEHTDRHLQLMKSGGEMREGVFCDGAYKIKKGSFGRETEGRIPRNVLSYGHACADQMRYKKNARALGLRTHGAPMPLRLARFLVEFLTAPGDLVVDPFGGSFTTAKASEELGRRWISTERIVQYVLGGALRFVNSMGFEMPMISGC